MSNSAHTTHNNALATLSTSWRERFGQVVPIVLPYNKQAVVSSQVPDVRRVSLALPQAALAFCQPNGAESRAGLGEWLLAAFGAYLARLSRVGRFDVGVRDHRGQLGGASMPYLPLRIDVGGVSTFDMLLQRVQSEMKGLATVGLSTELPEQEGWSVAVDLAPTPSPSAGANNRGGENISTSSSLHSPLPLFAPAEGPGVRADFTMRIAEHEGACDWLYNAQVLDEVDIATMQGQFLRVLESIVANPTASLSQLRLLSESERNQLLVEFNDTAADYAPNRCLHELFEQQVARTPDAEALVWETERLSYQQLNEKANQLAHYLRRLGVGHGVLVGINLSRSVEMVVGVLAVLKAGGAYVPLDPAYPQERLAFIIDDTQAPVLLTQAALLDDLPANTRNRTVICLDRDWHLIAQASDQTPVSEVRSDNLGYVIYTSGSTGRPKGVAIEHRSAVTLVDWALDFFGGANPAHQGLFRGTLFSTSICFDLSVFELFVPLSCGGKVILAENALQLPTLPAAHEVTLINTVPSAMAALVRLNGIPTSVEAVILAGEPLKTSLVAQIYEHQHIRQLFDFYGPSEDTTYSTHALRHATGRATIGRPIANTQLYLLDDYMQPVPLGVPGQIYLGGAGLARGYLKRPDLTAERFIPNPFSAQAGTRLGTRLYDTGDLARYRPDGKLEFLGRVDHQVKIRGYRIELGEIEAALMRHPAIRENVVVASEMPNRGKRLVAYVVPEQTLPTDSKASSTQQEQITAWQAVWNDTYREQQAKTLFHSWNSSYDEQPIPESDMQEWLDYIVERALSLQPKRVLELGCGTGLLLFELAPYTLQYWASDFSEVSLKYIKEQIAQLEHDLPQVQLFQQEASDFTAFGQEKFDLILINSVLQYFPTMAYLLYVLEQAVNVVQPGGAILLGDVRHLGLLEAFHASVAWHNASDSLTQAEFKQHVQEECAKEEELLIEPAFFEALQEHLPQITYVEIKMKHGSTHNELTRFRYDVLLHVRGTAHANRTAATDGITLHWQQDQLSLAGLSQLLSDEEAPCLTIKNVPNPRLMTEHQVLAWLRDDQGAQTVGEAREWLARQMKGQSLIEPEELWAFAYNLPYLVQLTWASSSEVGYYDVLFTRYTVPTHALSHAPARIHRATKSNKTKAWQEYANNPLQAQQKRQLIPQLRDYLQQSLPDYMVPALFMTLDALPLTPNGKVNRRALPKPDLSRSDLGDPVMAPRNAIETQLAQIWSEVLGVAQVGIHDNFFELGGDSILNIRILAKANQAGLRLTPKQLWQHQTIADLAKVARLSPSIQAEQGIVTGSVPLTAYYHWFFEQQFAEAHHWNMPLLFEVHVPMGREWLEETINALLSHHDALRMRFTHRASGWQALIINQNHNPGSQSENVPFLWVDLSALPANQKKTAMQQRAGELQASLNLSDGPLVKVAYFDMGGEQADYFLFIIHHLVVDGVSWLILLEDFQSAYQQLAQGNGNTIKLPRKSTSFKKWATYPLDYVQSGALEQELDYWLAIAKQPITPFPIDLVNCSDDFSRSIPETTEVVTTLDYNLVLNSCIITQTLTINETEQLLREVPTAYNTQINDVLLTALLLAYHKWCGNGSLLIDLEGHGREEITPEVDLSRTVSGFTTIFPVYLKLTQDPNDLGGVLMAMKEQLRTIPQHGIGYGLLRYLHPDKQVREQLRLDRPAQLIFNYLGQFDQILPDAALFTLSREAHGPIYSPRGKRTHLIEINGFVADGQLHLEWTYSQAYHQQQSIQQFAQHFMQSLRALITHCQAPEAGRYTATDFPEAELGQEELEELLSELGEL